MVPATPAGARKPHAPAAWNSVTNNPDGGGRRTKYPLPPCGRWPSEDKVLLLPGELAQISQEERRRLSSFKQIGEYISLWDFSALSVPLPSK